MKGMGEEEGGDVAIHMYSEDDSSSSESSLLVKTVTVEEDQYFGGKGLSANVGEGEDVIVRVENVHKTYLLGIEGIAALRGVSVSIRRGEFVCIYGTSGGGKTRFFFFIFLCFFLLFLLHLKMIVL